MRLLSLARAHRFAVIEDDYDHEFHYDGRPILPLASADVDGVVVYVGTLSKVLAPGLRIGFVVAPTDLADRVRALRLLVDMQDDHLVHGAVAELFEDGELQRHLNRSRRVYAARRNFLVDALRRALGSAVSFTVPSGGLAVWARTEPAIDLDAWSARARKMGLAFRTGAYFYDDGKSHGSFRLGFGRWNERELEAGVRVLAEALPSTRRRASA